MTNTERGDDLFDGGPARRLVEWIERGPPGLQRAVASGLATAAAAWIPLLVLAAAGGQATVFLVDAGAYARFLVAIPVLIAGRPACVHHLSAIARYFLDGGLVPDSERSRYDAALQSTMRLRDSIAADVLSIVVAYVIAFQVRSMRVGTSPAWQTVGNGPGAPLTPAGWWHTLVSLPLLLVLLIGCAWGLFLWVRFLWLMSRHNLRLVAAHPDRAGGLLFVGHSVRAFVTIALAFGAIVAGAITNAIEEGGRWPDSFTYHLLALVGVVVALFAGPLLVFMGKLVGTWRRGALEYGSLAVHVGQQFERRWLRDQSAVQEALRAPDFSATTDLYQVVSNVYALRFIPIDLRSVLMLIAAALLPFIPAALLALPFDVVVNALAGLLL